MKYLSLLFALCLLISCNKTETKGLVVQGNIKGLKKGTVYLKKAQDTAIITVDSLILDGTSNFKLSYDLQEPQMFYLYLDKNSNVEDRISFFADKGITEINTTRKQFNYDAKINGSQQQKDLEDYNKVISKFTNKGLNYIKDKFDALKLGDTVKVNNLENAYNNHIKRKHLYTVNYALGHKDSEVAPYVILADSYNINIKLLDTVNNSLSPKVKSSLYGKKLQKFIDDIKGGK